MTSLRRASALAAILLLAMAPMLAGCLTKSTTVGDKFSGRVLVVTSPDATLAPPTFDIPASLSGQVWATEFPSKEAAPAPTVERTDGQNGPVPTADGKVGTQLSFDRLSTGQFGQLGDIIGAALPDSTATVEMKASRSGDYVRLRGSVALTDVDPRTTFISLTVDFAGPVVATNGRQSGKDSVTWIPPAGLTTELNADSDYADPATAAIPSWTWFMLAICGAVIIFTALAAYKNRDNSPRPGRRSPHPKSDATASINRDESDAS